MIKALRRWWKARQAVPVAASATAVPPATSPESIPEPPPAPPSGLPFQIRPYIAADAAALVRVCGAAIRITAAGEYDQAQRDAWQAGLADERALARRLAAGTVVVAEWQQHTVAFAQLLDDGKLDMIYVHPDAARLGIATLLYQYLEDEARILGLPRLTTDASHTARGFFRSLGFTVVAEEQVERGGVPLDRSAMEKRLV